MSSTARPGTAPHGAVHWLLSAAVGLVACGGQPTTLVAEPLGPTGLDGEWRLVAWEGEQALEDEELSRIALRISGSYWHGSGPCNDYFARAEFEGDRVRFHDLSQTGTGCLPDDGRLEELEERLGMDEAVEGHVLVAPPEEPGSPDGAVEPGSPPEDASAQLPRHEVEVIPEEDLDELFGPVDVLDYYLDALAEVERYEHHDRLTLIGPDVRLVYEEVPPPPDAPLLGTRWVVHSHVLGSGPDSEVTDASGLAHLLLHDDHRVEAHTGCREVTATWHRAGDQLWFEDLETGPLDCPEEHGEMMEREDRHQLESYAQRMAASVSGPVLDLDAPEHGGLGYRSDGGLVPEVDSDADIDSHP